MFTLLISVAHASAVYPTTVASDLGMPCVPQCTLCHTDNLGGVGTITTEFGLALVDAGLAGGAQTDLIGPALDAMAAADSDGDGTLDLDELMAGDDPNGGPAFCDAVAPVYGCFNHTPGAATTFGVVLSLLALRRRRQG